MILAIIGSCWWWLLQYTAWPRRLEQSSRLKRQRMIYIVLHLAFVVDFWCHSLIDGFGKLRTSACISHADRLEFGLEYSHGGCAYVKSWKGRFADRHVRRPWISSPGDCAMVGNSIMTCLSASLLSDASIVRFQAKKKPARCLTCAFFALGWTRIASWANTREVIRSSSDKEDFRGDFDQM